VRKEGKKQITKGKFLRKGTGGTGPARKKHPGALSPKRTRRDPFQKEKNVPQGAANEERKNAGPLSSSSARREGLVAGDVFFGREKVWSGTDGGEKKKGESKERYSLSRKGKEEQAMSVTAGPKGRKDRGSKAEKKWAKEKDRAQVPQCAGPPSKGALPFLERGRERKGDERKGARIAKEKKEKGSGGTILTYNASEKKK